MSSPQKQVLIVGGGVAGLAAAQTLSKLGLKPHLIEKQDHLGGHARDWACMATDNCQHCGACMSVEMAAQTTSSPTSPRIYLNSGLDSLDPLGDGFRARLSGPESRELVVDGFILASGMTPFDPTGLESMQYSRHPRVVTTADLNHLLRTHTLDALLENQPDPAIAFVQCVGSRNRTIGNDYCSQVCCKVALRQAGKLKDLLPEAEVDICHIDLQLMGKEVRSQFEDLAPCIRLLQGVPGEIRTQNGRQKLMIVREDALSGERQAHYYDLIVLSVGMRPAHQIQKIMSPLGVVFDDWGFISSETPLPPRIQVAGAAAFPTDINGARQQGINAAMGLATALGCLPAVPADTTVAVLGQDGEGHQVARAVQAAGYRTYLVDPRPPVETAMESYEILSGASLSRVEGTVGRFELSIESGDGTRVLKVGALVVANGVQRQSRASQAPVVSLSELERTLVADWEQVPERVVFWLDHSGPEHKTNCRRALESAIDLTASGRQVCLIMEKMLVHGPGGQRLYDRARRQGVRFLRAAEAKGVTISQTDQGLQIDLQETSLAGLPVSVLCDLVVASDPVQPASLTAHFSSLVGEPVDREGYAQWANVRHRPIDSRRRGIYFVGGCHDEQDNIDLDHDIQSLLAALAHQQALSEAPPATAEIDPHQCRRCLTCFRTCPHGAVVLSQAYQPVIRPEACLGCGRCAAQCPADAIQVANSFPLTKFPASPQTVIFTCQRSAYQAAQEALDSSLVAPEVADQIIAIPCARGGLTYTDLLRPLTQGTERVVVAACHSGNCRSLDTSQGTQAMIADQAQALGLKENELQWQTIAANEPLKFQQLLQDLPIHTKDENHG